MSHPTASGIDLDALICGLEEGVKHRGGVFIKMIVVVTLIIRLLLARIQSLEDRLDQLERRLAPSARVA